MTTSRGVKKVSEDIMREGRAIIVTEANDANIDWDRLPEGTIRVDPSTGAAFTKVAGHTDWQPLVISRLSRDIQSVIDSVKNYSGRVNQLEIEQANILMKMEAKNMLPDCNLILVEDFSNPSCIDEHCIKVKSTIANNDGIDVESVDGVFVGSWYNMSDGVNQEMIQVKAIAKNGAINRIVSTTNVQNTYVLDNTFLYRTTAKINNAKQICYGAGDKRSFTDKPATVWKGVSANVASTVTMDTSQSNVSSFTTYGDVAFTVNGEFTLATN